MLLSETLAISSIEAFLLPDELAMLARTMEEHVASLPPEERSETARTRSVHSVPGLSLAQTMRAYEPAGRFEQDRIPDQARRVLDRAALRGLPLLRRVFPSVRRLGAWIYVEYGPGQYVTSHADYSEQQQIAGCSISLSDAYTGGSFRVETTSSPELWQVDSPDVLRPGVDATSEWFSKLPTTRWTCTPRAGSLICWGSQLAHATDPVVSGRAKKMVGFLLE